MTRSRSFTGAFTTAVMVVVFGNQWVSDWIHDQFTGGGALSWLMRLLTSPSWSVDFAGSDIEVRTVIANDLRAILTVVLVYILLVSFRKTFPEGFAGFVLGWSTLIFASAIAAFAAFFVLASCPCFPAGVSLVGAVEAGAAASVYGLMFGWLVGFMTSVGRNIPWPKLPSGKRKAAAS